MFRFDLIKKAWETEKAVLLYDLSKSRDTDDMMLMSKFDGFDDELGYRLI